MNAKADYVQLSQERFSALQSQVAERERANQQKAKELHQREQRMNEQEALLLRREEIFDIKRHQQRVAKRNRASLIAPLLLITCVVAGYAAYEQIDQQRQYFQQVKAAEKHVDKLTRVLSITQERMVNSRSTAEERSVELAATQSKLEELEIELLRLKVQAQANKRDSSILGALLTAPTADEPEALSTTPSVAPTTSATPPATNVP